MLLDASNYATIMFFWFRTSGQFLSNFKVLIKNLVLDIIIILTIIKLVFDAPKTIVIAAMNFTLWERRRAGDAHAQAFIQEDEDVTINSSDRRHG